MAFPTGYILADHTVTAEPDTSRTGAAPLPYVHLIIGQRVTAQGTAANDALYRVFSADEVGALADRGSMLHRMALGHFANNTTTATWVGVLGDDVGGTEAAGTIQVTGAATAAGTIAFYYGGVRITTAVANGDSAATIAANMQASHAATLDLPSSSSVLTDTVTVTYRHKGLVGNDYDLRHSANDGESLPAGVGLTITPMSGGAGNPSLAALIAAMGDEWYHVITHPYTDSTSLDALEAEMDRRSGPLPKIPGVIITSASGSVGTLSALGLTRNSEHSTIVAQSGQNPLTPPSEFAAQFAAVVSRYAPAQPNLPLKGRTIVGALPPAVADRFSATEQNELVTSGIAATGLVGNRPSGLHTVTTYQQNASGAPDVAFRDIQTALTLIYLRWTLQVRMRTKYNQALIAVDEKSASKATGLTTPVPILTPGRMRAEALDWGLEMQGFALLEQADKIPAEMTAIADTANNRMIAVIPLRLIGPLRQTDTTLRFSFGGE